MRPTVSRVLAGLVACLFAAALFLGDFEQKPLLEVAFFAVITCLFATYALLGQRAADGWLNLWFGVPMPEVRPAFAPRPPDPARTDYRPDEYGLVLHNDETHTYEYVIGLLLDLFGWRTDDAYAVTHRISRSGRAVVFVGSRAECERFRALVEQRGPDPRLRASTCPLVATVERMPDGQA